MDGVSRWTNSKTSLSTKSCLSICCLVNSDINLLYIVQDCWFETFCEYKSIHILYFYYNPKPRPATPFPKSLRLEPHPPRARSARRRPESVALSRTGKNGFPENGTCLLYGAPGWIRTNGGRCPRGLQPRAIDQLCHRRNTPTIAENWFISKQERGRLVCLCARARNHLKGRPGRFYGPGLVLESRKV